MSLTILIHVYAYKDIGLKNDNSINQPWKDISLKNDNSIDQPSRAYQPRINIQGRVGARRLVGANLWLARSAKNNLIDGLFSELHTINTMYVEPILGRLTYWKMWQCICEIVGWTSFVGAKRRKIFDRNSKIVVRIEVTKDSREARKIFERIVREKFLTPPLGGMKNFWPPPQRGPKTFLTPPNLPPPHP